MPTKTGDVPDGIPALVGQVLAGRGISVSEMAAFLAARPSEAGPPMLDLERAVERLHRALEARERIVVYGDYDVDGIAGSAILVRAFRQLGTSVSSYIPNRYEEGYGINAAALRQLAADGTRVVVSVDCGVTAVNEALLARELGIDLIVTDHHHPPERLPAAYALVNPRRPGDPRRGDHGRTTCAIEVRGLPGSFSLARCSESSGMRSGRTSCCSWSRSRPWPTSSR